MRGRAKARECVYIRGIGCEERPYYSYGRVSQPTDETACETAACWIILGSGALILCAYLLFPVQRQWLSGALPSSEP